MLIDNWPFQIAILWNYQVRQTTGMSIAVVGVAAGFGQTRYPVDVRVRLGCFCSISFLFLCVCLWICFVIDLGFEP